MDDLYRSLLGHISFFGGIAGALILASNLPISGWAYIPFVASNLASLYLMRGTNTPIAIRNQIIVFLIINVIGIFRWLI